MTARFQEVTANEVEILLPFVQAYYDYDGIVYQTEALRAGLTQLTANPSFGRAWLIQVHDLPVGYFILSFGFDLEFGGRQATLTDFYLEAPNRRQGLGTRAFRFIEETLPTLGVGALELQVERDNVEARAFYAKIGMRPHDRIPMSKRLDGTVTR